MKKSKKSKIKTCSLFGLNVFFNVFFNVLNSYTETLPMFKVKYWSSYNLLERWSCVSQIKLKGIRPSALIFHEWNKNCFLFVFIISNRIQFKWKIIKRHEAGLVFTKINIMSYHNMKQTWHCRNKLHNFLLHTKIKSKKQA